MQMKLAEVQNPWNVKVVDDVAVTVQGPLKVYAQPPLHVIPASVTVSPVTMSLAAVNVTVAVELERNVPVHERLFTL
jgi:hypothetical protein